MSIFTGLAVGNSIPVAVNTLPTITPASWSNGLPFDSTGALIVNPVDPIVSYGGGIPFVASGAVAVGTQAITDFSNAIPFVADGSIAMVSGGVPARFLHGVPLNAAGQVIST